MNLPTSRFTWTPSGYASEINLSADEVALLITCLNVRQFIATQGADANIGIPTADLPQWIAIACKEGADRINTLIKLTVATMSAPTAAK
jgi:hypothetical protein